MIVIHRFMEVIHKQVPISKVEWPGFFGGYPQETGKIYDLPAVIHNAEEFYPPFASEKRPKKLGYPRRSWILSTIWRALST